MQEEKLPIPEEVSSKLEKTCITSLLKTNQIQNGLKHSEYSVYRRYCAQKIKHMRSKIGVKYGGKKKKQVEKKIGMGANNRVEFFWVSLYNAEKYWAHAMEMKQGLRNEEKKALVRHNIKKKLKRAIAWGTHFRASVEEAGCKRTLLEADSHLLFFKGLYKVECREYKTALEDFVKARAILTQLVELVGSIEKVHMNERIEQIDNNTRFCRYQLNEYKGKSDELVELQKILLSDQTLSVKLEDLADQVKDESLSGDSVKKELFGKAVEIQHPKLIHYLREIELIEKSIKKDNPVIENELEKKQELMIENFTEIFNKYDDAVRICEQHINKEGTSDALQKLWKNISRYFQACKASKFLDRNWSLLHQQLEKFTAQKGFENLFSTKLDFKNVKPQDLIKVCDLTIQILTQLKEIAAAMDARCDREDLIERYYQYVRGIFVSFYHISQTNYMQGISLLCSMKKKSEFLFQDIKKAKPEQIFTDMARDMEQLEAEAHIIKVRAHMTLLEEQQQEYEDLPNILGEMDVDEGRKVEKTDSLFDILHYNDENFKKTKTLRNFANFPPDAKLIPTDPIMLNVCYSFLEYPSLDHKIEKKKEDAPKTGFLGKIGGFFGGGKK